MGDRSKTGVLLSTQAAFHRLEGRRSHAPRRHEASGCGQRHSDLIGLRSVESCRWSQTYRETGGLCSTARSRHRRKKPGEVTVRCLALSPGISESWRHQIL